MPIYTYICQKCKTQFDLLHGVNQDKTPPSCVKCKANDIKRSFGNFGIAGTSASARSACGSCSGGSCSTCSH